jgi:alkylhydroperoxidase family enzyme
MSDLDPRIPPLPAEGFRPEWLATLARIPGAGLKGAGFPKNVLGTIAHNPESFGPFLDFWVANKLATELSVREQELVILRMACLYRSPYVWKHHVPVALEFGIGESELDAVREGRYEGAFGERESTLLLLTDELTEARTIRQPVWERVAGRLSHRALIDLISLVAQYCFFALVNNAAQVEIEEGVRRVPWPGSD